jgi:hypothetical protein
MRRWVGRSLVRVAWSSRCGQAHLRWFKHLLTESLAPASPPHTHLVLRKHGLLHVGDQHGVLRGHSWRVQGEGASQRNPWPCRQAVCVRGHSPSDARLPRRPRPSAHLLGVDGHGAARGVVCVYGFAIAHAGLRVWGFENVRAAIRPAGAPPLAHSKHPRSTHALCCNMRPRLCRPKTSHLGQQDRDPCHGSLFLRRDAPQLAPISRDNVHLVREPAEQQARPTQGA